ncbi:L-threonylcarbamoyladenylate synthase [Marinicella rhabdoformis]|uniref:L-threonylcarbamoyladenylate synthase n=1 Tax=Marinicella rhabdoformis TaxID=2580566 RepID=UPI001C550529|nr:L-threonylcarbamoyladenylate synthase [Marinicella rhabdoformis]
MMPTEKEMKHAIQTIQTGGLLVYPTEAVFGLGCDYRNQAAVSRLLTLKQRDVSKGLILIASHVQQILPLIQLKDQNHLARAIKTWPGHNTWVFQASQSVPDWISGQHDSVAVRVSTHPTIKYLCDALGHAIVSTSANISGHPTATNIEQAQSQFGDSIDCFLDAPLGQASQPSTIRKADTGEVLR